METTTIITVFAVAWVCGCIVGIGIGQSMSKWKQKREGERKFIEKHKRVG